MSPWVLMGIAVVIETIATLTLRWSDGWTRPVPAAITIGGYAAAFFLLGFIVRQLPVAVTYAVWSGAGIALVTVAGWILLDEKLGAVTLAGILMVVVGIGVIQLSSS